MRLATLATVTFCASVASPVVASAADTNRGACARLAALLEVADLAEGYEDIPAIAKSGDDAACAKALRRLGGRAEAKSEASANPANPASHLCPRKDGE